MEYAINLVRIINQNMNKTSYKSTCPYKRQSQTQDNFRTRKHPFPQHLPKHEQNLTLQKEQLRIEMNRLKQYPITSTNWCLFNSNSKVLMGNKQNQQREVASLTKIMTTITSLELFERYSMDKDIMIRVSSSASSLNGTSAELQEGKYIRIYDLFYGAMLPSGNDAAFLLSEVFGLLLFYEAVKPESKDYSQIQSIDLTCYDSTATFVSRFLKQMNKKAKELKLTRTTFTNPHGLQNILNVSTAKDMLNLSRHCYQNERFKEIVNCQEYKSYLYNQDMEEIYCLKHWVNTNKLLELGWEGIKTGQTQSAGSCLSSIRDGVYIVVLNSSSRDDRFEDTMMLWEWHQNTQC